MTKVPLFQFLTLLMLLTTALAKEEYVLEITDSEFDARIAEYTNTLVLFYAPWCGNCKKLKPEYARAAEFLIRNDPPVALLKIDCTGAGKKTCQKHSITSYPTLKIFRNDKLVKRYDGPREADGIIKYMRAEVRPIFKELKSIADFEKFQNSLKESAVVGFFETHSELHDVFFEVAEKLRGKYQFAYSSDRNVLDQQGVTNGVVLFRPSHLKSKFEPASASYAGNASVSVLNDFIRLHLHGLVGVRKLDNQNDFKRPLIIAYFAIDYDKNPRGSNYWRNRILMVAKDFEANVTFAISSADEFAKELNKVGVELIESDKPIVVATDSSGKKYPLKEEFSVEALKTFVINLLNEKLEAYVKSQPVPETQEGPVLVAVAKNFEDLVLNNAKDTLIEFYAPWCGYCQKFAPVYEELARELDKEDIAIVKVDATANDVPYEVPGYPTIYWVPKHNKENPVQYQGERSVSAFIKFIARESTNELAGWDRSGNPRVDKSDL